MSSKAFVSVRARVDWRLNGVSNKHTFGFVYFLRDDFVVTDVIQRHVGNLYESLRSLGVSPASVEISNILVDRV